MRTHFNHYPEVAVEGCSVCPSQIEPDGATSLHDVVKQFMSGVPVHTPQQYYFDFDAALGGVPHIDDIDQIPAFDTLEQVDEYFQMLKYSKQYQDSPKTQKRNEVAPEVAPEVASEVAPEVGGAV